MSLHPSLKLDVAGSQQRSVLTRIERIKDLMKKGLWKEEGEESKAKLLKVTGLPKTKIIKLKAKKAKAKTEEGAAGAAAPAAGAKPEAAKKPDAVKKPEGAKEKK